MSSESKRIVHRASAFRLQKSLYLPDNPVSEYFSDSKNTGCPKKNHTPFLHDCFSRGVVFFGTPGNYIFPLTRQTELELRKKSWCPLPPSFVGRMYPTVGTQVCHTSTYNLWQLI